MEFLSHHQRAAPFRKRPREDPRSAFRRAGIVAVAPTFANAIVGAMDPKLAFCLLGKRPGSLDRSGLSGMEEGSALASRPHDRPVAIGAMRDVVICFGHVVPFVLTGFTPKRKCLTFPAPFVVQDLSRD